MQRSFAMWWVSRVVCVAVVACALTVAAQARGPWLRAELGPFEVFTNGRAKDAKQLVGRLEQFREQFLRLFPGRPFREPRVTMVIFESDRDFDPYKPLYKGKPAEIAGVFTGLPDESVIALSLDRDLEETIPVILHEYVHMLMHARGFHLPPWLNEGVAELYSTFKVEDGNLTIGRHIPYHLMVLNQMKLMPLERLFAIGLGSPEYNEGLRQNLFYAQSWALLHYWDCGLANDPQQAKRKSDFLMLLQEGLPAEQCMQQAFGKSLKEMERELTGYVRGGKYYLRKIKVENVDYAARVNFQPAGDWERDVALANLKWRLQQNGDATFRLLEFAEKKPNAPRPYELLAAISMIDGEPHRAVEYWRQAAAKGSTNPYVYEQLARDSLSQYMWGMSANFRLPEETTQELRGWLDRAIELAPNYAEAWDWRLLTEAFSKKLRSSVVNAAVARYKDFQDRPRYLGAIALIALRIGDRERAEGAVMTLLRRPDVVSEQGVSARKPGKVDRLGPEKPKVSPWLQPPDRYPDVYYVANLVKDNLPQKKPAEPAAPERAEAEKGRPE